MSFKDSSIFSPGFQNILFSGAEPFAQILVECIKRNIYVKIFLILTSVKEDATPIFSILRSGAVLVSYAYLAVLLESITGDIPLKLIEF